MVTPTEKTLILDLVRTSTTESALHRLKDRAIVGVGCGAFMLGLFLGLLIR